MNIKDIAKTLNDAKIIQECGWEESIPGNFYEEIFNSDYNTVAEGLKIEEHRHYETSIIVFDMGDSNFLGMRAITQLYSESSCFGDIHHTLKFFPMKEVMVKSYEINN